jgi:hypothetical protein
MCKNQPMAHIFKMSIIKEMAMENTDLTKQCIELSAQCIEECKVTATMCSNIPNMKKCMELCLRCAEECEFLINTCMAKSISNPEFYDHCSQACSDCASECEKYDLMQCKKTAEICRKFQLTYIFQSYQTHQPITVPHAKAG